MTSVLVEKTQTREDHVRMKADWCDAAMSQALRPPEAGRGKDSSLETSKSTALLTPSSQTSGLQTDVRKPVSVILSHLGCANFVTAVLGNEYASQVKITYTPASLALLNQEMLHAGSPQC